MDYQLTNGSVWKKLLNFALPVIGANLLQAMYGTVDLMVVGRFADAAQVSAVATGSMTMQTFTGMIIGLTMGSTILLGQSIGMENYGKAARAAASSILLFVLLGLGMAAGIAVCAGGITELMQAPPEAVDATRTYIRICGGGILCIVLFNALGGMFRGIGDSKTPLWLMGIACTGNIIGDLLLVGVLQMGSSGAAWATVSAQGLSILAAALVIRKRGFGFPADREQFFPAKAETLQILKFGLPMAAQEALTGVSFMVILAILNTFGVIASAGVGVGEKICGLMFIIPMAMMEAVSAFSAQNAGAGREDRARRGMMVGIAVSVAMGLVMFASAFLFGKEMASFFSSDREVCLACADYLRSYGIDVILVGFAFNMSGYLNGLGHTAFVAAQGSLCTFLVRIPVSWVMSRIPGVSLFQVGFATPLASVLAILLHIGYIRRIGSPERCRR